MKQLIVCIIVLTCACKTQAQVNAVLNPSFEQHAQCPQHYDQIRFANNWNTIDTLDLDPSCAPEYYNACDTTNHCTVPLNNAGYQYPRTGNGYSGGKMFYDESVFVYANRDYIQGRLFKTLTIGSSYCITFYVSLAEISEYAVSRIGAYLDNGEIDTSQSTCGLPQTGYIPQIEESSIINDTLNWVKVQGSFIANGTERFITIGNFRSKINTSNTPLPYSTDPIGYYYVDDVSVIESTEVADAGPDAIMAIGDSVHIGTNEEGMPNTWYVLGDTTPIGYSGGIWVKPNVTTSYVVEMDLCGSVTRDTVKVTVFPLGASPGLSEGEVRSNELHVLPNPARDALNVVGAGGCEVVVCDMMGRVVVPAIVLKSDKEVVDISSLPKGIYVVVVVDDVSGERVVRRVVKE